MNRARVWRTALFLVPCFGCFSPEAPVLSGRETDVDTGSTESDGGGSSDPTDPTGDPRDPGDSDDAEDGRDTSDGSSTTGDDDDDDGSPSSRCGDGMLQTGETCDDGPDNGPEAACLASCQINLCGDGFQGPDEECDDGNILEGDGCTRACRLEPTVDDACPADPDKTSPGTCGCGIPDIDSDGDQVLDCEDGCPGEPTQTTPGPCGCLDDILVGAFCGPGQQCDEAGECGVTGTGVLDTGFWNTCAIDTAGVVRCERPATAPPSFDFGNGRRAFQVGLGQHHACALLEDGSVLCWSSGNLGNLAFEFGQLGALDVGEVESVDLGGPAIRLSVGRFHNCAVMRTGAVKCWGQNNAGQLGNGNTLNLGDDPGEMPPPDVPLADVRAIDVAAGSSHSCAILAGGRVRCWGSNGTGQLGYGDRDQRLVPPARDVELGGSAIGIAAGIATTCAVLETGTIRCWGVNDRGQLGYGTTEDIGDDETPADAGDVPVVGAAFQVMLPDFLTTLELPYACGRFSGGSVRCWGGNTNGRLGYLHTFDIGDDETPAAVEDEEFFFARLQRDVRLGGPLDVGGFTVALADSGQCLMTASFDVRCWGRELVRPVETDPIAF